MSGVTREDFKELKDSQKEMSAAVSEMAHAITELIAIDQRREADMSRQDDAIKLLQTRQYEIEATKLPAMGRSIEGLKQWGALFLIVVGALCTGAIGMFFNMAKTTVGS